VTRSPVDQVPGGVRIHVWVQPGAKRTEVVGMHGDAVKLRVAAPPEKGRANEAAAAALADLLGVRPADVTLVSGTTSRSKTFEVRGITTSQATMALLP
jgi:uncharacterized protein (TIGR00251 family)